MQALQNVFSFHEKQVRVVVKDGDPWFVAKDVCEPLGLENVSLAINGRADRPDSGLDPDEKGIAIVNTPGGPQEMAVVNEPGLYSLVMKSRKPEAKAFKRWITHEVIPSIRKHGMYAKDELLDNPDLLLDVVSKLKEERDKRIAAERRIELDRPKVIFAEALETSNTSILIGELAKILKQNGIDIGQNRLFALLREQGYLGRKGEYYNMPTQRSMDLGLFEIKTRTINNPDGSVRVTKTTKVTGKGQMYFVNKFKNEKRPA